MKLTAMVEAMPIRTKRDGNRLTYYVEGPAGCYAVRADLVPPGRRGSGTLKPLAAVWHGTRRRRPGEYSSVCDLNRHGECFGDGSFQEAEEAPLFDLHVLNLWLVEHYRREAAEDRARRRASWRLLFRWILGRWSESQPWWWV